MINIILTTLLILLFFFLGYATQAFKKLFGLLTKILLNTLNFFGIRIQTKETSIRVSEDFKRTYKDIKKVKLLKQYSKQKSSIDWIYFSVLILALVLFLFNLKAVTNFAISNWIYSIMQNIPIANKMFTSESAMYTYYTAILFSVISFSLSKILSRWKETKKQRQERKELKIKLKAIDLMSTKELLTEAKKKDEINYKKAKNKEKE